MKCPFCGTPEDKVIDSRSASDGAAIRRRRECLSCERRFTTYERLEESPLLVIKRDGRREAFDRKKMLAGLLKACEKRAIAVDQIDELADAVERELSQNYEKEVSSVEIGKRIMVHLHELDEVAYVRFASVYRQFKDLNQFMKELHDILDKKG